MRKRFNKMKIRFIFILVLVLIGAGIYWLNNRHSIYDFSHLTRRVDYGAGRAFTPVDGVAELNGMLPAADNPVMTLYVDPLNSNIAVLDKRNGHVWYSSPPEAEADPIANPFEKDVMRSLVGFRYYDELRRWYPKWSYADGAENGQFELESIPNGVRIIYEIGDTSLGIDACPKFMEIERFNERVLGMVENSSDIRFLGRVYIESRSKPGFMEMPTGVRNNAINIETLLRIFSEIEYTLEELEYDNKMAEHEMEINLDSFVLHMEFILNDDTLTLNLPLDKFVPTGGENPYFMEIMKYFGAGTGSEEGYIFVPSGSGGLIEFNNGKNNEEPYVSAVYGLDPLMNYWRVQQIHPVRLPVLGIKKDNAAMIAWVESGAAMASVNANISGNNHNHNIAWFTFLLRDSMTIGMAGGSETDMLVIQQKTFDGDITINYRFTANEEADYVGMALAYQRNLVEQGKLTRLTPTENTPFYLDIIGAVEKLKFVVGTPYNSTEPMTTYQQASEIVNKLNAEGVFNIQMRWLGWFNRGVNHDAAKKINWLGSIGSRNDMRALHRQLAADGGGLYPSVNFQMVSSNFTWPFRNVRNINQSYEVARDPVGFLGFMSGYKREFLNHMGGPGLNTWHMLVSPGVLPFHIDSFIGEYDKLQLETISLGDMGDVLSSNIYRKNTVDREHSRMITVEQLNRLNETYDAIMVTGGNDYSFAAANHLLDVPTEMNRHYLLDHEIPFYQIVISGFIDYTGTPVNTRDVQDTQMAFLNMLATGAAPHYLWSYAPTRNIELTPYEMLYSTHYVNWFDVAVEQYRIYNEIHKPLRTLRITGHEILSESSSHATAVTVTRYENGTRIYVNTTREPFHGDGFTVPARGYLVVEEVTG